MNKNKESNKISPKDKQRLKQRLEKLFTKKEKKLANEQQQQQPNTSDKNDKNQTQQEICKKKHNPKSEDSPKSTKEQIRQEPQKSNNNAKSQMQPTVSGERSVSGEKKTHKGGLKSEVIPKDHRKQNSIKSKITAKSQLNISNLVINKKNTNHKQSPNNDAVSKSLKEHNKQRPQNSNIKAKPLKNPSSNGPVINDNKISHKPNQKSESMTKSPKEQIKQRPQNANVKAKPPMNQSTNGNGKKNTQNKSAKSDPSGAVINSQKKERTTYGHQMHSKNTQPSNKRSSVEKQKSMPQNFNQQKISSHSNKKDQKKCSSFSNPSKQQSFKSNTNKIPLDSKPQTSKSNEESVKTHNHQKRTADVAKLSGQSTTNKKQKLSSKPQQIKKSSKNKKRQQVKNVSDHSNSDSPEYDDSFDASRMQGYVGGGDFDSDGGDSDLSGYLNKYLRDEDLDSEEEQQQEQDANHYYYEGPDDSQDEQSEDMQEYDEADSDECSEDSEVDVSAFFNGKDNESDSDAGNSEEGATDDDDSGDDKEEDSTAKSLTERLLQEQESDESDDYEEDIEDYSEESTEEDENYSDFDEEDYVPEEYVNDNYDYSIESNDEDMSDYDEIESSCNSNSEDNDDTSDNAGNDSSYDFDAEYDDEDDSEYKLPEDVPEDLIIHAGTAEKRNLKPEDNVKFDSDNEESQIVEIQHKTSIKSIQQPKAYHREELIKLSYTEAQITKVKLGNTEKTASKNKTKTSNNDDAADDDCPKLVPIIDDEGFELYNPNNENSEDEDDDDQEMQEEEDEDEYDFSLGSDYELVDSENDSLQSEDINHKYVYRGDGDCSSGENTESSDSDDDVAEQPVDIIDATNIKYNNEFNKSSALQSSNTDEQQNCEKLPSMQLYEKVDAKASCTILSANIMPSPEASCQKANEVEEQQQKTVASLNNETVVDEVFTLLDSSSQTLNENQDDSPKLNPFQSNQTETASSKQNINNYATKFYNAFDNHMVLVLLKDPFYIYGTVSLTLLAGSLEVYGHNLNIKQEYELFSPRGCSVIEIKSKPNASDALSNDKLKHILNSYEKHFAQADLNSISGSYNAAKDCLVLLKRNETRKKMVMQFKKFMNENVFPNIQNINMDRPLYNTEHLLQCMINTTSLEQKCLNIPTQWQQYQLSPVSRVMLAGGKGVGKSTLLRYLINKNITTKYEKILVIDLDIGQPELFLPQTVSCCVVKQPLLGPGFLLNLQPDKSYAIGHVNIAMCAQRYKCAVEKLLQFCKNHIEYQTMPWLINTMGYNKGFGLELLSLIVQQLPLTDLIQLQSSKDINNFDSILFPHVVANVPRIIFYETSAEVTVPQMSYQLHVWQSALTQESRYQKEWGMSAKDMRYAMLLTRLSDALKGHAEWLTDCKPFSTSLTQLKLLNLLENTASLSQESLAKAMEANLVYLCGYANEQEPIECFGLGVVRGIDFHVQQLYLTAAMPDARLKNVNCLALGEMPLPNSIFTNQGSKVKDKAPFVYNTIAAEASKSIKQIYHRPAKFLRGQHKSLD